MNFKDQREEAAERTAAIERAKKEEAQKESLRRQHEENRDRTKEIE